MEYFYWNPQKEIFTLPLVNHPIAWYGALFALGFAVGYYQYLSLLKKYFNFKGITSSPELEKKLVERLSIYIVLATVIGARLFHFIFYENPSEYLLHPQVLLQTWKGGLASHGAAIAILFATYRFSRWTQKLAPISWLSCLDMLVVPTALAGCWIRLGNFINQEILGTKTFVPWAVVFGSPMDGSLPFPRHPVQLYEAFAYFSIFVLLFFKARKKEVLLKEGRLLGLFLILVFSARFVLEFFKEEQSLFFSSFLTMGQLLSVPFVFLGFFLFRRKLFFSSDTGNFNSRI
ncbi:MAG TPA: prolipoprotein diacylglyceryl transferase [Chlamydiales bacterium]|nr:prolipoprotein diacylglyceryl transferase [Chlamydiales bacterium]